ncbi:MAG: hypothetical protein HYZ71_15950 [Deltaproteobacteria bacterium]|nr:hypothetical protein [Deltaproteobacteria bacterium]
MKLSRLAFFVALIVVFSVIRCGSSSSSSNSLSVAMAAMALTSPAASSSSSSTTASLFGMKRSVTAFMQFTGLNLVLKFMGIAEAADETGQPTTIKPLADMKNEIKSAVTGDPTTLASSMGNPIEKKSFKALCYGPAWTDDATGSSVNRPSGDLGIVYATATDTDLRACATAQVEALMAGAPSFFNNFIKLQAIMLSAQNKAGKGLPAEGATEDDTALMPTITGMTITNADLKTVDVAADANAIYKTVFDFTSNSKTGSVTIFHSPANADNTNFSGLAYATLPENSGNRYMSMVYSQTDNVLKISAKIMVDSGTSPGAAFTSGNEVDFSKFTTNRSDFHWIVGSMNSVTGDGTMHYAWQAGGNDGATRTFAFNIAADGTGVAFAGFGPAITSLTGSNTPWTTKMFCNWLNGLSNGTPQTKVQKQVLSKDTTSGKWKATSSLINFAPTDACTKSGTWTVSGATGATFLNGSKTTTSTDLVTAPTSSDVAAITLPTFTIPTGE